jgi:dihydroorotate dehydrogenase electron transfer subunit
VNAPLPLRADAIVRENRCDGGPNYRLRVAVADWPGAAPGHFVMLATGSSLHFDPLLPRPMAVYRSHAGAPPEIEVLYKATGRGTQLLAQAQPGDTLRLVGPLGVPFALAPAGARSVLVGGGTGIASLYELAREARARGPVVVLLGARRAADLMGRDDFAALGVDLRLATEDGSAGERCLVTALLEAALAGGSDDVVYACGPTPMMRRAAEIAAARGRACQVSLENHMACGFGVCLGCAVPRADGSIALVCRDGPVFAADAVSWAGVP